MRSLIASMLSVGVLASTSPDPMNRHVVLGGEYLGVASAVFLDFSAKLEKERRAIAMGGELSEFQAFATRLENYSVEFWLEGDIVRVEIRPNEFRGVSTFGGGAKYKVHKRTFDIIERVYDK